VRTYETEAIVLRTHAFGEADLVVHLLTPERGRIAAIAKHARKSVKRFPGSLDLFNHLRVEVRPHRRAGLPLLLRAELIAPFLALKTTPVRYALGCYLLELVGRLAPEEGAGPEMKRIFDFTAEALAALAVGAPDARSRVLLELRALDVLGLRPELRRCVRCGADVTGPAPVPFHIADGGVLCGKCADPQGISVRVHLGTLRVLEQGLRFPVSELARLSLAGPALAEAQQLVARFQRYHVGIELRSERFLSEVLQTQESG
jgi:DNA repair protein RecO (recombination protein O)